MKDLEYTKGNWEIDKRAKTRVHFNDITIASTSRSQSGDFLEEEQANAKLIADAGTTTTKCGLLPSELLEQRDKMLSALKEIKRLIDEEIVIIKENTDDDHANYIYKLLQQNINT